METLLKSINIENFRGFKDPQTLEFAEENHITFLTGANNTGKSLIAKAISFLNYNGQGIEFNLKLSDNDFHLGDFENKTIRIVFELNTKYYESLFQQKIPAYDFAQINKFVGCSKLALILNIVKSNETVFSCFLSLLYDSIESHSLDAPHNFEHWTSDINNSIYSVLGGTRDDLENIIRYLHSQLRQQLVVFNSIRSFDYSTNDFGSTGSELFEWIKEAHSEGELSRLKTQVGKFLLELNLQVPLDVTIANNGKLTFVFENNLRLPHDSLGTGYSMIYILLAEVMRNKKKIVVIDEPECHIHPGLVRQLVKILRTIGNNQLIISTHSPSVIESAHPNDVLYRFYKIEQCCKFTKFQKHNKDAKVLRNVVRDLGVIPGDALLSNCVIWVEGPSEVLWLRAWLNCYVDLYRKKNGIKQAVIEGMHYSILISGGSLITSLSFDDAKDETYHNKVYVNRINPNPFVIVDSDNKGIDSAKSKRDLEIAKDLNEFLEENIKIKDLNTDNIDTVPNFWRLRGRELENYCHPILLEKFYHEKSKHPNSKISGITEATIWDVYNSELGAGSILEKQGITGVSDGGTLKHKKELAFFAYENFTQDYFLEDSSLMKDLKSNLDKLLRYVIRINAIV